MYTKLTAILIVVLALSGCVPITPPTPEASAPEAPTAPAAPQSAAGTYRPLAAEECEALRAAIESTLSVEATLEEEAPFVEYIGGQEGTGCQITVTGTGEDFTNFVDVARQLEAMLTEQGWTQDMAFVADGPTGTAMGLRMDNKLALLSVGWDPSEDADCPDDQPISACELAPEQQLYTITLNVAELTDEPAPTSSPVAESPLDTGDLDLSPEAENVAMVVRQMLMQQLQVDFDDIQVVSVEAVEWTDGCLGLGGPAESCLQAIVPGYRVTLSVEGQTYIYRTDAEANAIRLEEGPTAQIGQPMIVWTSPGALGGCAVAEIGTEGVAWGACGGTLMQGYLGNPERQEDLAYFVATYAPFEAETPVGHIVFHGTGSQQATPAEQRMLAEWAGLAFQEAAAGRSGAAWGLAFAWHREGGIAGFCDDLTVYVTGQVYASSCAGTQPQTLADTYLTTDELTQLYEWVDTLQNFEFEQTDPATADAMTIRMVFSGAGGQQPSDQQQHAILDFAQQLYVELTQ
jgi:hypothetical protein